MVKIPKKVVIIVSGVVVLTGASGATAFFIGKDRILGPSAEELGGVECTDVIRVADMRKDRAPWLRKYVRVPPGTDGMTRVKTALRVASKVQETLPADLIEISVIDQSGPEKRAQMRGRAIGAQVILVKDPTRVPGITDTFTVQYYQGAASGTGMFYGEESALTSAEAEELLSQMKELSDCAPPPEKEEAGDKKGEKKKESKHEKKPEKKETKKEGEGHEAAAKEGEGHEAPAKEGGGHEAKKEEKPEVNFPKDVFGKMQKAAFDKAEAAKEAEEEAKHEEEAKQPGMVDKMLGMVGLGGSKDEGEHGASPEGGEHGAPAEDESAGEHAAPVGETDAHAPAKSKPVSGHEAKPVTKPDGSHEAKPSGKPARGHEAKPSGKPAGGHEAKPAAKTDGKAEAKSSAKSDAAKSDGGGHETSAQAEEKSGGFMSKMLGMVGLGDSKPKETIEHSGGPAIVSGKKVIKDASGHEPAAEGPGHEAEKAAAHGETPASAEHGADPAADAATGHEKPEAHDSSAHGDPAQEAVNATDHAPAKEPKKDDHAADAHGG